MPLTPEQRKLLNETLQSDFEKTPEGTVDFSARRQTIPEPPTEEPVEEKEERPKIRELAKQDVKKRAGKIGEIFKEEDVTTPERVLRTAGQVGFGLGDLTFRALQSAGKFASAITPNFIEKPVMDKLKGLGEDFLKSETGQKALFAMNQGMATWEQFRKENPREAKNIEGVVGIAEIFPIERVLKLGVRGAGQVVRKTKQAVETVGEVVETAAKKQGLKETLEVVAVKGKILSKAEKQAALEAGRGTQTGILKKTEIAPSATELRIAETVKDIVSPKNSGVKNINKVDEAITALAKQTDEGLKNNNAIFNKNQIKKALNNAKEESKVIFAGDKTLQSNYNAVIDEMLRQVDGNKNNLAGLLQARKNFDKVVREKFPNIFDKVAGDNVRANAVRDVRRSVNDFIEGKLPDGNEFKALLRQQSDMYKAITNISRNAIKDIDTNVLQRAFKNIAEKLPGGGLTFALLGGGAVVGAIANPFILGTLLLGGSAAIGKKIVTSKAFKSNLSKLLLSSAKVLDVAERKVIQTVIDKLP